MRERHRNAGRWSVALALAVTLSFPAFTPALANVGAVNTVNDGHDIIGHDSLGNSKTYYNTPGSETTFINSAHTGLYLKAGDTVIGREVNPTTLQETGNGGNLHFSAPGQVVQLDGNIDVSAILKGGAYGGNGGHVTIDSGALYQNGQIFANGNNGGMVQMNVSGMTMGPGARIEARGLQGNGGVININSSGVVNIPNGAVVDSSGAVIGTYNTNVIQVKGSMVNLDGILQANGLNPGQAGGKVAIYATDSLRVGPNGKLFANGAEGFNGYNPTNGGNGGNGGMVLVSANKNLDNDGLIAANGGKGGTNPDPAVGPVNNIVDGAGHTVNQQVSNGQNGGNGGNGGQVEVYFKDQMTNNGKIQVVGDDGGKGQAAKADAYGAHQYANGGTGGNGGDGGFVKFFGTPSQAVLSQDHLNVSGGHGAAGGAATTQSACGCATPGTAGACGKPGGYSVTPYKPPSTPTPPLYPPYPREYTRLGDSLPGAAGQVVNFNRSIFLARAPLPVIQKKAPPPPPVVILPAPARKKVVHKPAPKRVPVRGYW